MRLALTEYLGVPVGTVMSVMWRGRETIDDPIPVGPGDNMSDVLVTATDRPTSIDGTLVAADGRRTLNSLVVAYPVDQQFWSERSRRVRVSWPDPTNHFSISGLPPGQYLVAVLTDVEPDSWFDPAVLSTLASRSTHVTLVAGERQTMELRASR